ncbi:hypothetical protein ElyMa_001134300 [Elysia marginata]|uniref:Uncharacterized protein n=1 Tax=Elysia marginata TaxID=1093978 RepID=A0AAV4HYL2_9GAST|nr:hypothetical protein ElyMa_001134300 [Elysia marginata]
MRWRKTENKRQTDRYINKERDSERNTNGKKERHGERETRRKKKATKKERKRRRFEERRERARKRKCKENREVMSIRFLRTKVDPERKDKQKGEREFCREILEVTGRTDKAVYREPQLATVNFNLGPGARIP